jgi:hypothetical protein
VDEETGQTTTTKTPSTPADPAEGSLNGVRKVLGLMERDGSAVTAVSHGTTVATNHLEAHETAHSAAPGIPLENGLDDQATTASTGACTAFQSGTALPAGANGTSETHPPRHTGAPRPPAQGRRQPSTPAGDLPDYEPTQTRE